MSSTLCYLRFLEAEIERRESVNPLRARVLEYLKGRGGTSLGLQQNAKAFFARLSDQGLITGLKDPTRQVPTLGELEAWQLTLEELVADDGVAASFAELQDANLFSKKNPLTDLLRLRPTVSAIFGPFSSPARRDRLNPTMVANFLGPEIKQLLERLFESVVPIETLLTTVTPSLDPTDFAALKIRFDSPLMQKTKYRAFVAPHAVALFRRHPFQMWEKEAGLTLKYLHSVLPDCPTRALLWLKLGWSQE